MLNAAAPFWLVAWGETHIDSSIAAIAQATVPIFSLLIGLRFLPHERIGPLRIAGVCLGLAGVVLIAGVAPAGNAWAVAGTLAVVLASVFYASAGIYGQLHLKGTISGPVLATGSMLAGGAILLPFAVADPPTSMPTAGALGSLLLLALVGTALAQLILFRVIGLFGARRLSLVTYLMPGFALVYGALILDERLTAAALIGLALILVGVALGSGAMKLRRRGVVAAQSRAVEAQTRMRNAVCGGQPRRTSALASWRSTLRSSASTNASSLANPTEMSCSIRQLRTRAAGSGAFSSARSSSTASIVGSPLMPLSARERRGGSAPRRSGRWRTTDASACPSSRASRAKRYHSIHVVSLCPSPIAAPSSRGRVVCTKVYRQDVRKPCARVAAWLQQG